MPRSARSWRCAIGLTVFNAYEILRLQGQSRDARQAIAQNDAQARDMRDKAHVIRRSIDRARLDAVQAAAREANSLIDRRTFSWTELLNQFQATLPPDVRIAGVLPQIDTDGRRARADLGRSHDGSKTSRSSWTRSRRPARSPACCRDPDQPDESTARFGSELQGYYAPVADAARQPKPTSEAGKARRQCQRAGECRAGEAAVKALFTFGADVPFAAGHRRSSPLAVPVGIVLAINVIVLVAVVLPLRALGGVRIDARARSSAQALARRGPTSRGRSDARRAGAGDRGSRSVLCATCCRPTLRGARRMTHVKLAQLARSHDVSFQSGAATHGNAARFDARAAARELCRCRAIGTTSGN